MKSLACLLYFVSMASSALGQNCTHTDLSTSFTFQTKSSRHQRADGTLDSCVVTIHVINKLTKKPIQTITYSSNNFFSDVFQRCNYVRSYSTGRNKAADAIDNDYGDLVIADFNFDGKEDFAAKNDSGGNGGPLYNFYIQNSSSTFSLDTYLTDKVSYFPEKLGKSTKTLSTLVHANSHQMSKTIHQFNPKTNKWRQVENKLLP